MPNATSIIYLHDIKNQYFIYHLNIIVSIAIIWQMQFAKYASLYQMYVTTSII